MTRNSSGSRKRLDAIELLRRFAADLISLGDQLHAKIDTGKTLTEAEDNKLHEHPLFRATELVAERTGYPPLDVQEFAERVGTSFGLSYRKGRKGSLERDGKSDKRDLHFMLPQIRELDVVDLLEELERSHPGIVKSLGISNLDAVQQPEDEGKPVEPNQGRSDLADNAGTGEDEATATNKISDEGMGWRKALHEAEQIRLQGEGFTSYTKMAKRIGCSPSTLHKAIKDHGTVELQEWASKQRGESRLNVPPESAAIAFENKPQSREPDPADVLEDADIEVALAYLINEADPDERARIHALDAANRRQLAETVLSDPDREDEAFQQFRAKRSRRE